MNLLKDSVTYYAKSVSLFALPTKINQLFKKKNATIFIFLLGNKRKLKTIFANVKRNSYFTRKRRHCFNIIFTLI